MPALATPGSVTTSVFFSPSRFASAPICSIAPAPKSCVCGARNGKTGVMRHTASAMPALATPFTLPGTWYRGNLHCHTTSSDGAMPPDRLVAHYSYAGWDFISITDHGKVTTFPEGTNLPD